MHTCEIYSTSTVRMLSYLVVLRIQVGLLTFKAILAYASSIAALLFSNFPL